MAGEKPTLPNGFIGAQPRFSELKLKTDSHKSSQIKVEGKNMEWIKISTGEPVK
ncbi:kyphoscoliosis peptidase, partial [Elysia marginata]